MNRTTGRRSQSLLAGFDELPDAALVSPRAVAQLYGVNRSSIWRWAKLGKFPPATRVGVGSVRWRVGDLRRHISNGGAK